MKFVFMEPGDLREPAGKAVLGAEKIARAGHIADKAFELKWKDGNVRKLEGKAVGMRLYFRDMRIYSLYGA